jgi:hypothetical protein
LEVIAAGNKSERKKSGNAHMKLFKLIALINDEKAVNLFLLVYL